MSENSSNRPDKEGDIFDDDGESFESENAKDPTLAPNILNEENELRTSLIGSQEPKVPEEEAVAKSTVVVMSHLVVKQPREALTPGSVSQHQFPLPLMQGNHSIMHDMKFGWKPEVAFESAPIPLYFSFAEQPLLTYYQEQAYYQNSNHTTAMINQQLGLNQFFKIIYYGPRFKDSFEMHKNFVKPSESTYEFAFPKFFGLASAKAFYDSFFAEEHGLLDEDGNSQHPHHRDDVREFTGMAPDIEWDELHFNSNFENGNLDTVVRTSENNFDLFLRADTNTRGHFGWFHFETSRTTKGRTVHFNIINMAKSDSLHNHGMQINVWSQKKNRPSFVGWERSGFNIKYGPSKVAKEAHRYKKRYYTLSFSYTFEFDDDKVWFAYTIPYTYSMLTQYIKAIVAEQRNMLLAQERQYMEAQAAADREEKERQQQQEDGEGFFDYAAKAISSLPLKPRRCRYIQESVLCKSLGGVEVPLLTITNFDDSDWQRTRKVVFIQARLHPGETSSSWIVHGLVSFLISKSRVANELRSRLVFKIIPMANPDGVIIGNTRTTLIGKDMNRQFPSAPNTSINGLQVQQQDSSELPQVEESKLNPIPFAIRDLLLQIQKQGPVISPYSTSDTHPIHSFWDIHQHSKKKSIFIYGPHYPLHSDKYLKIRLIPKLISDRSEMFRFYSCRFKTEKYKENCARMTIGRNFNIANCFTLECSSYGYIQKNNAEGIRSTVQFKEADLIEFGKSLAESLLEYQLIMERDAKVRQSIMNRMNDRKNKLREQKQAAKPGVIQRKQKDLPPTPNQPAESDEGYDSGNEDAEDEEEIDDEGAGEVTPKPILEKVQVLGLLPFEQPRPIDEYLADGTPAKKPEEDKSDSSQAIAQAKDPKRPKEDDRFYSDEEDDSPKVVNPIKEEDDEDEGEEDQAQKALDYERSPVTKPFDLKGLMQIKQPKSKLDIKLYQVPTSSGQTTANKIDKPIEKSPVSSKQEGSPKSALKASEKKSQKRKVAGKPKTLEQLLAMIQTDVIREEQHENDSTDGMGEETRRRRDSSDDGGNDEDFLSAQDQRVLRDRILHAIEVFSKWSPNPRREILKQKRAFKLSIENRSRAVSSQKDSERSFSDDNGGLGGNGKFQFNSPRKNGKKEGKNQGNSTQPKNKKEQMDIIDNFLKEFGIMNPANAGQLPGVASGNDLTLVGSKISPSKLPDFDDDALSSISNEILRFQSNKKDAKRSSLDDKRETSGKKSDSMTPTFKASLFGSPAAQGKWQLCSQTNQMILKQQLESIMSLNLDASARKLILQKFFQQNPSAAFYIQHDTEVKQGRRGHPSGHGLSNAGGLSIDQSTHRSQRAHSSITLNEESKDLLMTGRELQPPAPLPVPFVTVSSKVMNLTGGLQANQPAHQARPRSVLVDHHEEPLRIKKGAISIIDDRSSMATRLNSSLYGFDIKLQTLNVKLSIKQKKRGINNQLNQQHLREFKEFQSTIASKMEPAAQGNQARPVSSTNSYMKLKHDLVAGNSLNSSIIHKSKERPKKQPKVQTSVEFVRYLPVPKMREHEAKTIESPLKIQPALKQERSYLHRVRYLDMELAMIAQKVNAGTDTDLGRKLSKSLLRASRKIILEQNGSQTLINVDGDCVKAVDNLTVRNNLEIGMPVYLQTRSTKQGSAHKASCSRDHASRQSMSRRSGRSQDNDRVSQISVNITQDRIVTQNNSPRTAANPGSERSLLRREHSSIEAKSIISNPQKQHQLGISQEVHNKDLMDVQFMPRRSQVIEHKKHGSLFTKSKEAYFKWLDELPRELKENHYNPLAQEKEGVHQIGILQWAKMHSNSEQEQRRSSLMVTNKASSTLHLDDVQVKNLNSSIRSSISQCSTHNETVRKRKGSQIVKGLAVKPSSTTISQSVAPQLIQKPAIPYRDEPSKRVLYEQYKERLSHLEGQKSEKRVVPVKGESRPLNQSLRQPNALPQQRPKTSKAMLDAFYREQLMKGQKAKTPADLQREQMMEYMIKNKSQIVRDIMLASGERLLMRGMVQPLIQGPQ